ncbi:hypothetical protein T484DRAFT_1827673, partial [Baffinella frigidus]
MLNQGSKKKPEDPAIPSEVQKSKRQRKEPGQASGGTAPFKQEMDSTKGTPGKGGRGQVQRASGGASPATLRKVPKPDGGQSKGDEPIITAEEGSFSAADGQDNERFCSNCFCYPCDDKASLCKGWLSEGHCHANHEDPHWSKLRSSLHPKPPPQQPNSGAVALGVPAPPFFEWRSLGTRKIGDVSGKELADFCVGQQVHLDMPGWQLFGHLYPGFFTVQVHSLVHGNLGIRKCPQPVGGTFVFLRTLHVKVECMTFVDDGDEGMIVGTPEEQNYKNQPLRKSLLVLGRKASDTATLKNALLANYPHAVTLADYAKKS